MFCACTSFSKGGKVEFVFVRDMQAYGGADLSLLHSYTQAVDKGVWLDSGCDRFIPGEKATCGH